MVCTHEKVLRIPNPIDIYLGLLEIEGGLDAYRTFEKTSVYGYNLYDYILSTKTIHKDEIKNWMSDVRDCLRKAHCLELLSDKSYGEFYKFCELFLESVVVKDEYDYKHVGNLIYITSDRLEDKCSDKLLEFGKKNVSGDISEHLIKLAEEDSIVRCYLRGQYAREHLVSMGEFSGTFEELSGGCSKEQLVIVAKYFTLLRTFQIASEMFQGDLYSAVIHMQKCNFGSPTLTWSDVRYAVNKQLCSEENDCNVSVYLKNPSWLFNNIYLHNTIKVDRKILNSMRGHGLDFTANPKDCKSLIELATVFYDEVNSCFDSVFNLDEDKLKTVCENNNFLIEIDRLIFGC